VVFIILVSGGAALVHLSEKGQPERAFTMIETSKALTDLVGNVNDICTNG
jgi:hypothetical protein